MAENTNNSLSDLNNEGHKFNRLLNSNELKNSNSVDNAIKENEAVKRKLQSSKDDKEKEDLQKTLNRNNTYLNNVKEFGVLNVDTDSEFFQKSDSIGNPTPTSLFDRDAFIDYGRYINGDGSITPNWQEYKKDDKGNFLVNNNRAINQPVLFKDNSLFSANNSDFSNEGLSIPNLIIWSEKYPALQLRYQDFVYCRKLGYYPNNRLIILRRFKGGVPDNLFDYYRKDTIRVEYTQPLSTMITWLSPEDDIIDMEFNEVWEEYGLSVIETIKNSVNNFINNQTSSNSTKTSSNGFEDLLTAFSLDEVASAFGTNKDSLKKEDGVPFTRSSVGNPNLIKQAAKRKTGGDGLKSDIQFKLKFEYELRFINQIDPSIALLDLMSNAMRMGTSEAEFKYNIPFLKNSDLVKGFINGDITKATEMFEKNITVFTKEISDNVNKIMNGLKTAVKNVADKGISGIATSALEYIVSRYREDLKSSLSVDTGLPSGIWHVTIGNPKAPIISCGDLIIKNSKLKLGKEMGYNDFPNSFEITYDLGSARTRGRNELIRIFNSGRGRLYTYPSKELNPDYDLYNNDTTQNKK